MDDGLKIGQSANRAGVTAKAIRFYERKRILQPARRAVNQYRLYDDDAVGMLQFVKQATDLGLTLAEIKEITLSSIVSSRTCSNFDVVSDGASLCGSAAPQPRPPSVTTSRGAPAKHRAVQRWRWRWRESRLACMRAHASGHYTDRMTT